jgi:hypothetical protein
MPGPRAGIEDPSVIGEIIEVVAAVEDEEARLRVERDRRQGPRGRLGIEGLGGSIELLHGARGLLHRGRGDRATFEPRGPQLRQKGSGPPPQLPGTVLEALERVPRP